jgi:hypothetical protein
VKQKLIFTHNGVMPLLPYDDGDDAQVVIQIPDQIETNISVKEGTSYIKLSIRGNSTSMDDKSELQL